MTALDRYSRLESPGLWRDDQGGPRREVIVSMGDATLVISEFRSERALAHWSLPAVLRVNPGLLPARFAPGPDALEELEIEDPEMLAALSRVQALIEAKRPHPGRLRLALLIGAAVAVAAAGLVWVPGAIVAQAVRVVPPEMRAEIGRTIMADVFRLSGAACTAPEGRQALGRLGERLFGAGAGALIGMGAGLSGTRHLPGGTILIGRDLVEGAGSAEVLAGDILAEAARMDARDPLGELLAWTGTPASLGLLTTGALNPDRMVGYAEVLLTRAEAPVGAEHLAARFRSAATDPSAWANAVNLPEADRRALAEAGAGTAAKPVLSDADWVALQGICAG